MKRCIKFYWILLFFFQGQHQIHAREGAGWVIVFIVFLGDISGQLAAQKRWQGRRRGGGRHQRLLVMRGQLGLQRRTRQIHLLVTSAVPAKDVRNKLDGDTKSAAVRVSRLLLLHSVTLSPAFGPEWLTCFSCDSPPPTTPVNKRKSVKYQQVKPRLCHLVWVNLDQGYICAYKIRTTTLLWLKNMWRNSIAFKIMPQPDRRKFAKRN